jgi:hypothetical protein
MHRPDTVEFRDLVTRMKTAGKNLTWLAATLGVHHQTVASWHCDQRRIPSARLEQVRTLVAGLQ